MKKLLVLFCAAFILITGCKEPEKTTIAGNEYVLTNTPKGIRITIAFSSNNSRFFGKAVNNYFGTYKTEGDTIKLGTIGSTMMMGSPKEMQAETQFLNDLELAQTFQLTPTSLTLYLSNDKVLKFQIIGKTKE